MATGCSDCGADVFDNEKHHPDCPFLHVQCEFCDKLYTSRLIDRHIALVHDDYIAMRRSILRRDEGK